MTMQKEKIETVNFYARLLYDEKQSIFIIILSGSLDKEPILQLQEQVKNIIATRKYSFVVDLSHVTYISSTGLGFLMYLMKYRKDFVFLSSPPESILKAFKLLDTDDLFMFYYTLDELKSRTEISDETIQLIEDEIHTVKEITYKKRWVKILRENYPTYWETLKEVEKLTPYIQQAEQGEEISLPSEQIYTCVLYKFLERVIYRIAKIDREEVDDMLVELISKELMSNAIKHGYENRKEGIIEANYSKDDKKLEINFIDYGKGFGSAEEPHDAIPATGLALLRKIFDNVAISEAPKKKIQGLVLGKGTMVKLTKLLNS